MLGKKNHFGSERRDFDWENTIRLEYNGMKMISKRLEVGIYLYHYLNGVCNFFWYQ